MSVWTSFLSINFLRFDPTFRTTSLHFMSVTQSIRNSSFFDFDQKFRKMVQGLQVFITFSKCLDITLCVTYTNQKNHQTKKKSKPLVLPVIFQQTKLFSSFE